MIRSPGLLPRAPAKALIRRRSGRVSPCFPFRRGGAVRGQLSRVKSHGLVTKLQGVGVACIGIEPVD